jgi:predicted nucleic acid-binding protein
MRNGVFLDTSYLITLADPKRDRHAVAKRYYQEFLLRKMPMAISAIVVAEFCVRQRIETLPLQQLILVPFNHEDAVIAAGLDYKRFQKSGVDRQALKDDFKIIGHAESRGFGYVITDDAETMFTYCEALRAGGHAKLRGINLQDGYTEAPFTPDGQSDFIQVMEDIGSYSDR